MIGKLTVGTLLEISQSQPKKLFSCIELNRHLREMSIFLSMHGHIYVYTEVIDVSHETPKLTMLLGATFRYKAELLL